MAAITGNQPAITTVAQDAVQYERDLASLAQAITDLYAQALQLQQRQTVNDYVGKFNNTATYAENADGSVGAADQAPNTAHPMVGFNVSANDVSAFIGYGMNDFVTWYTGGATSQADRRTVVGKLLP